MFSDEYLRRFMRYVVKLPLGKGSYRLVIFKDVPSEFKEFDVEKVIECCSSKGFLDHLGVMSATQLNLYVTDKGYRFVGGLRP